MASVKDFMFHNMGRIGNDKIDQSQQTVHNTRFANHMLSDYFSENVSDNHVKFATNQPSMNFNGLAHGSGISSLVVDESSALLLNTEQQRTGAKIQLHQRPFATIPYLGRGSCNPELESKMLKGQDLFVRKSEQEQNDSCHTTRSFYPVDSEMRQRVEDPSNTVEEAALNGWVRGGENTRHTSSDPRMQK